MIDDSTSTSDEESNYESDKKFLLDSYTEPNYSPFQQVLRLVFCNLITFTFILASLYYLIMIRASVNYSELDAQSQVLFEKEVLEFFKLIDDTVNNSL